MATSKRKKPEVYKTVERRPKLLRQMIRFICIIFIISHINSVGSKHFIFLIEKKGIRRALKSSLPQNVSLEGTKRTNYESVIKPFQIDLSQQKIIMSTWSRFFFRITFYLKWILCVCWLIQGTVFFYFYGWCINWLIKCAEPVNETRKQYANRYRAKKKSFQFHESIFA